VKKRVVAAQGAGKVASFKRSGSITGITTPPSLRCFSRGDPKALRINRVIVAQGLTGPDEHQIRTTLVACTLDIAAAMQAKGVGNGCVDWEVPSSEEGRLLSIYTAFSKAPGREQPRGKRSLLRACP
jgi:hypothetical protein